MEFDLIVHLGKFHDSVDNIYHMHILLRVRIPTLSTYNIGIHLFKKKRQCGLNLYVLFKVNRRQRGIVLNI